ncbi:MAG: PHP domain-containing protein [Treponema sp.]|jgi:hypothetical protein|nr:PHP domain-containing protein [Treponema sp.]
MIADLHNHSCLSPCGSLELSPRVLLALASQKGVEIMALTDHNSALNCKAFATLAPRYGIIPLFGMEATTQEEIHILCLWTNLEEALAFSSYAYTLLFPFPNNPATGGDQVYVDEEDNILGDVEYFLPNALDLSVDGLAAAVGNYGGLVIPAHIDRAAFSMTSQLGVVVPGPWAALECVRVPPTVDTLGFPLITSSDAHYPEHVARRPFALDTTVEELCPQGPGTQADLKAFKGALSRRPRAVSRVFS